MKQKFLFILALLLTAVTGAWADNWDVVYRLTQTTSANWAALGSGSTTGWTIGSAGNTTYYYATGNLSFTNSNDGGSGLTILGTVYLYIPKGVTVTCTGHNASGTTGAGAGVELAAGNTLYLLGGGTINATGGNAANGTNGSNGDNSNFEYNNYCQPGSGGAGGNGGGGAGAGIGTHGGNGGNGGAGGAAKRDSDEGTNLGVAGSAGSAGATAGSMGTLYVNQIMGISVNVTGGSAGTGGTGGNRGYNAVEDPGHQYSASGGGGGGAGGGGGFANNIGTGGPGGGGGGGGAAGNSAWRTSYYPDVFFKVGAGGGSGGQNADGTYTANGVTSELTSPYDAEYKGGLTLDAYYMHHYEEGNGQASGGGSGSCGGASQSGSPIKVRLNNYFTLLEEATASDYGKVVCAAGHLHPAMAPVPEGCTAVGILGKVTLTGHGLILAMQNATNQTWNTINGWTSVTTFAGTTLKQLSDDAARGSLTSYTSATVSNWCVAQKDDYSTIFQNLGSTQSDGRGYTYDANVNAYITGVGGAALSGIYCTATSYSEYWAYVFHQNCINSDGYRNSKYNVRPVIGFAASGTVLTMNMSDLINGSGTEDAPYTISSTADWNTFASLISLGYNFSGEYVKLTADISVSEMAGAGSASSFQGTFLGAGHTLTVTLTDDGKQGLAPFRYISGATIKNLKVAGAIASNQYHSAGVVGFASGTNRIEDCVVTATLNISSNYAGGIIGHGLTSATTITGCVFAGTINGVGGNRSNIGGIWGWSNSATPTLVNCLEAGTYTNIASMHPMGLQSASGTINNCYYVNSQIGSPLNACTVSGAAKAIALDTAPDNLGDLVQDYGIVKAYANGLLYNGKYYVPFALSGSGTEDNPFIVSSTDDWNTFAGYVNGGYAFSGKFVKLGDDISVSTMAGTSSNQFQGIFDGDNNTLTFNKGTEEIPFTEQYCAPFSHVNNATFENLHVAGTIYTNQKKAAGIVGESHGALTLTGCRSSIAINSSISGDSKDGTHGGLVSTLSGSGNTITIEGCVFDGSFATTNGTNNCGGFIGWGVYNKPTIKNSLMKPGSVAAGMLNSTFARWYTGNEGIYEPTIDNCYYVATTNLPANQGTEAAVLNITPANPDYDYGMVKAYKNGIWFDGKFYGTPATVTLADNADNSTAISGADGCVADVTLSGRTLYKDGSWNTLCLPFSLSSEQIENSTLAGASIKELISSTSGLDGTTLTLNFTDATSIVAGRPYIIKWASGDNIVDIVNPKFNNVTIDANASTEVSFTGGKFVGNYNPFIIDDNNKNEVIYLGSRNVIGYATLTANSPTRTLRTCRAHFEIPAGGSSHAPVRQVLFNDGTTTAVIPIAADVKDAAAEGWYTIQGIKLNGMPTEKGLYIHNGSKVSIK